jgi:ribonuclease HI
MRLVAWTDGGGGVPSGAEAYVGVLVADEDTGQALMEHAACIGAASHNSAEYAAVLTAIRYAAERGATRLLVRSDSRLVVEQINGRFRVNKPHLADHLEAIRRAAEGLSFQIEWIPRAENRVADKLTWKVRSGRRDRALGDMPRTSKSSAETPAAKRSRRKPAAWRSLPPDKMSAYLLAHVTLAHSTWAAHRPARLKRREGESRAEFIVRALGAPSVSPL